MEPVRGKASWAVLIYSSASPDIEDAARASLAEVSEAARPDSVVVGAQLGVKEHGQPVAYRAGQRLAGVDMSRPESLTEFLRWGMQTYPAERYLVVLGGHGGGFIGAISDVDRRRFLKPGEMARALEQSGLAPEVLVFNACLMGQAEVAYELYPRAHYLVAAQGLEHGVGIPLGELVSRLSGDGASAARAVVEVCRATPERTPAMSAVDLSRAPSLRSRLDVLGEAIREHRSERSQVLTALSASRHFLPETPWDRPLSELRDLRDFCGRLSSLPGVGPAACAVLEELSAMVVDSTGGGGLSLYLPEQPGYPQVEEWYAGLRMSREGGWDETLQDLLAQLGSGSDGREA